MTLTFSAANVNEIIDDNKEKPGFVTNNISDGYHTFGELYEHRIHLYIALCKMRVTLFPPTIYANVECVRSWKHDDGSEYKGWFILQLETSHGQISYHLPRKYWDKCDFAETRKLANKWDGHTSDDVLDRLLKI